jgi:hypothetical protein
MALTAFALLIFSSAFGAGLGLVASTLSRNEDVRQAGAATAADPSDAASSQKTKPPARTIFGLFAELTAIVRVEGSGPYAGQMPQRNGVCHGHSRTTHLS